MWQELMIWSNETSADEPLLINANRTHVLPHALSDEELENETMKRFQLLKVCIRIFIVRTTLYQ